MMRSLAGTLVASSQCLSFPTFLIGVISTLQLPKSKLGELKCRRALITRETSVYMSCPRTRVIVLNTLVEVSCDNMHNLLEESPDTAETVYSRILS
jgi:hypothetical protein